MKKLFFFLTICIFSFTTLNADNEKQPVQNLPCTVIESNIIGEDIIIYLDLPGNENYTFTSSQQLTFSSSNGNVDCLLYTSPSPRDATLSRMPSSA